jgi:DNA-repair protein XRCC2
MYVLCNSNPSIPTLRTLQLLTSATGKHPGKPSFWSSLDRGDVVEIQGPPSSGKTHLMYLFLIICITPREHQSIAVGGWDKAGVVFDMDGSFDITRFGRLLLGRLKRFSFDINVAQAVAQTSLERLHVFRPTSSTQLATTLTQLGKYHAAHLPREEMGLVAIDSINAYHWPDRFTAEHIRTSPLSPEQRKLSLPPFRILTALSSLRATHAPVVIVTSRGLQSTIHGVPALTDPLISTHHIALLPLQLPRFQRDIHAEPGNVNAEERRLQRDVLENAEITASMRTLKFSTVHDFTLRITETEVLATS